LFSTFTGKDDAVPASVPTPKRVLITPSRKRALEAVSAPSPRVVDRNTETEDVSPAAEEEALIVQMEQVKEEQEIEQDDTEELSNYQILPLSESVPAISLSFPKELFRSMSIVGQFNNGFIIVRLDAVPGRVPELFLIDQHAANEKYLFEEYFRNIKVNYQRLIIPIKIRAPPWIEQVVQEYNKELAANGFISEIGVDNEGNRCIQVNSLPTLSGIGFNRSAALTVKDFMEITEALHEGTVAPRANGEDVLFLLKSLSSVRAHMASKACRTAIMVGDNLSSMKMTEIVHALSSLEQPWNCPHGRPTMKHLLSLDELHQFN
jgi:DNA mismatch repair protein PMS2